jgi:hypothetical protein
VANTGDLFVNFKVNADGLQSGFAALNGFVGKSKRDLAAMDAAVSALSITLTKLGIDPSFIFQMRDLAQIGTKGIPKVVEGIGALQRQLSSLGGGPKIDMDVESLRAQLALAKGAVSDLEGTYAQLAGGAQAAIDADARVIRSKSQLAKATEDIAKRGQDVIASEAMVIQSKDELARATARAAQQGQAIIDADAQVIRSRAALEKATQRVAETQKALARADASSPIVANRSLDTANEKQRAAAERALAAEARARKAVEASVANQQAAVDRALASESSARQSMAAATARQQAAVERLGAAQAAAQAKFDQSISPETQKLVEARARLVSVTDTLAIAEQRQAAEAAAAIAQAQKGGAITAALGKVRDFTGTIPARFVALRESMSSAFSSGATAATGALSKIGPAISSLPTLASTAFGRIKAGFQGLPAASSTAFEAIKSGAMKFDATLTGVAARAATAGRAIGAALYTALGPIGLILVAAGALYAVIEKFVSDAEARVAESNARIEASMSRTKAAIDEVLGSLKNIRAERERTEAKSEGIEADIKGLQALLNARGDGIRFTEEQIARERDLRDEIAANATAQKTLADASRDRAKAEETVRKAEQGLRDAEMSLNLGEIEESKFNELEANLKQQYAIQSAMRAQEEEAKKLAESTSQSLALEQQRLDLVSKVAEQRRREAEAEAQKQAVASILQGIEDERLRLTLSAADYEEMILDRRIKQAGIEDPQVIARIKAAQDALNLAKQQAEAEKVAKAAAGEKNTIAQETIRITEEARALQSAIDSIANEQAALEREMLELTMGKAAAEEHILRMKAQAAGLDAAATNDLIDQLKAVQDLRDAVAERKRTEAEQNRLLDERTRLEASIADATEAARAKAMEDDLRRQQMTETVSTAIGGLKIAATSDSIDIDKRIFDETKKQTDELKKINAALSAGGVAVLT